MVSKAEAKIDGTIKIVAVKMLKEGHTDNDVVDLVKEIAIMKRIPPHDNIINLLGRVSVRILNQWVAYYELYGHC